MAEPSANCGYFVHVAAMNPCPCGYYGDPTKPCTCAPLLDRIDIHVEVPRVDYHKLSDDRLGEASEVTRNRVEHAREVQRRRFAAGQTSKVEGRKLAHDSSMVYNADMRVAEIRQFCKLDGVGESLMRAAMGQLKLARTIADLAGCENIQAAHLAEALQYRPKVLG